MVLSRKEKRVEEEEGSRSNAKVAKSKRWKKGWLVFPLVFQAVDENLEMRGKAKPDRSEVAKVAGNSSRKQ